MRHCIKILLVIVLLNCSRKIVPFDYAWPGQTVVRYNTGEMKARGVLDSTHLPLKVFLGEWCEYYKHRQIKNFGHYRLGTFTDCCLNSSCENKYNYRVGGWSFLDENGVVRAHGKFEVQKFILKTQCGQKDTVLFGVVNETWEFYDDKGKKIVPNEDMISKIEQTEINGSFGSAIWKVDKRKREVFSE